MIAAAAVGLVLAAVVAATARAIRTDGYGSRPFRPGYDSRFPDGRPRE